jgi:hypothetical protein
MRATGILSRGVGVREHTLKSFRTVFNDRPRHSQFWAKGETSFFLDSMTRLSIVLYIISLLCPLIALQESYTLSNKFCTVYQAIIEPPVKTVQIADSCMRMYVSVRDNIKVYTVIADHGSREV